MKPFNWILSKPDNPIIDVALCLSKKTFVKEYHKDKNLTDREYILFALLVYARVLRLLPVTNKDALAECYSTFIEIAEHFKEDIQSQHFEKTMDIIGSSGGPTRPWRIRMGKMHIYTGGFNTKEVQKYAYVAFMYAWGNISPGNRHKLLDGFYQLSCIELKSHITPAGAVQHPDSIINGLFS